jgi:cytoskeletal protein CcmA (bactofilin family)
MPRVVGAAWSAGVQQRQAFATAQRAGESLGMLTAVVQVLILALSTFGLLLVVCNLGYNVFRKLWQWSQPTQGRRVLGALASMSIIALVTFLWRPQRSSAGAVPAEGAMLVGGSIVLVMLVVAFLVYRRSGDVKIPGPFRTKQRVGGSNPQPPSAGVTVAHVKSRTGMGHAAEQLGYGGAYVYQLAADGDVQASSAPPDQPVAPTPLPTTPSTTPSSALPQPSGGAVAVSLIAPADTFEGQLTTTAGVRVLGTLRGGIASQHAVWIDPGAEVETEIMAAEVVIGGSFRGKLTCHRRAEITATGQVHGTLATGTLLLHEGGFFAGTLHMQPPAAEAAPGGAAEASRPRRARGGESVGERGPATPPAAPTGAADPDQPDALTS